MIAILHPHSPVFLEVGSAGPTVLPGHFMNGSSFATRLVVFRVIHRLQPHPRGLRGVGDRLNESVSPMSFIGLSTSSDLWSWDITSLHAAHDLV